MVQGINTNVEYLGEIYHIQSEDCGPRRPMIKSLVFDKGGVVTAVETSYAELAQSPDFTEKEVARRLTIQHWKIAADLQRGALCLNGEEPGKTQVERRSGVDRRAEPKPGAAQPPRPRAVDTDRRVTVLSMVLAFVSVMLGFLAIRGLPARPQPDPLSAPTAPAPAPVSESLATPREPVDAPPPAAQEPRVAEQRPRPAAVESSDPPRESPRRERATALPAVMERTPQRTKVEPPAPVPVPKKIEAIRPAPAENPPPPPVEAQPPPPAPPAVAPGDLVDLAEVDVPPLPTIREMPSYTKRARKKKQEGTVEMHLLINERGSISDLRLKKTIPDSDLNETAINSVRRWRFEPARENDVAVRVWKPVSVVYSIESGRTRVDLVE